MKALGYIRVSTEEQAKNGESLEAQEQAIRSYCRKNKLNIAEILCEPGVSGSMSITKRPIGKTIDRWINEEGVRNIVAVKLDRMFRNTTDAILQSRDWMQRDVALHLLDFGGIAINTISPEGKMMFTMRAGFAEMELDMIRQRTQTAMDHKRSKGECIGSIPFGYERQGDLIVELPCRPVMMQTIKELTANGYGSRFIADVIRSDYGVKCSHTTIINVLKSGETQ